MYNQKDELLIKYLYKRIDELILRNAELEHELKEHCSHEQRLEVLNQRWHRKYELEVEDWL